MSDGAVHPVPHHIRNAPTRLMKQLGYGQGYVYPHDFDEAIADQDYLPSELRGRTWYRPSPYGYEKEIERRIGRWREILDERRHEGKETR